MLIARKRDGGALTAAELDGLVAGFLRGDVADYQMAAFLMAAFLRGLDAEETVALTRAMLRSGDVLELRSVRRPKVDKHSTGGVGDKVSLCLAPLVAAAGAAVPMISGRGLGHTGGTLDKLEAIPGYRVALDAARFEQIVRDVGCSLIGQTDRLAPADRRIYALRDVTGTVESIPLIVASILSKKLAAGLGGLVLDVKCGRGAFMKTRARARALATALTRVGGASGLPTTALLTDMDTPLGLTIGNALETKEAIAVLHGGGPPDLRAVTFALGAEMLAVAGIERDAARGRDRLARLAESGAGAEVFARMIRAHGGDARVVAEPDRLPRAPVVVEVSAARSGHVHDLDPMALGLAAMALGAGRRRAEDVVDPAVGIELCAPRGVEVARGAPLAKIHARTRSDAGAVAGAVAAAFRVAPGRPRAARRVLERVG
ncbi:MAG: thymidine phosphorylase [Polyangiaceae bacterium]|nr:thymidine phosphorylase [Polyangiaceae bacterium]